MKKKVIATSLLTILVGTYAAPFVSAEETKAAPTADSTVATEEQQEILVPGADAPKDETKAPETTDTTETTQPKDETTESTQPKDETTESTEPTAPKADATPSTKTDDSASKGDVDSKLLTPETKSALTDEQILGNARSKYSGLIQEYGNKKGAPISLIAEYRFKARTANSEEEAKAAYDKFVSIVDAYPMYDLISDYVNSLIELNKGVNVNIDAQMDAIKNATTRENATTAYNEAVRLIDEAKKAKSKLTTAKNQAKADILAHYNAGEITLAEWQMWTTVLDGAPSVEDVQKTLDNFHKTFGFEDHTVINLDSVGVKPGTPVSPNPGGNGNAGNGNAGSNLTAKPSDNGTTNTLVNNGKKEDVKPVVKNVSTTVKATNNAAQLPKTGETTNNFTALGLMSVALGSLAMVFKRKEN